MSRFEPVEDAAERSNSPGVFPAIWSEEPVRTEVSFRPYRVNSQGVSGSTRRDGGGFKRALFPLELVFCKHLIMLH